MEFRKVIRNLPIRYKIAIACMALFVPFAILSGALSYSVMRDVLEKRINGELSLATESTLNMVQTSVRLSIRNYLRSVSETNSSIVSTFYQQQLRGELTEAEAKARAAEVLLSQPIAKSGYLYCLDSQGTITVHPESGVLGRTLSDVPFVAEQMRRKTGYIEYDWQNPGDPQPRPKALWMSYFEPWDWIISATAYRDEFDQVVNINDFRKSIESLQFMASGYSYVLDAGGNLIVHPTLQGENVFAKGLETPQELFKTMLTQYKGEFRYQWQNPGEEAPRQKVVVFNHIPEVDWYVASSAYLDDLYGPIDTLRNFATMVAALCLVVGGAMAMKISSSITGPLRLVMERFSRGATGDYTVRTDYCSKDEIGQLSAYFNGFMAQLDSETRERKRLERQVTEAEDQERMRIGQDLHDDLAPHLIGIEVMCRVLQKKLSGHAMAEAEQAENIRALVAEATSKTRALARGLCPIHRVEEGLGFALRELAETVSTIFNVPCTVSGDDSVRVGGTAAVHVFRIAQQAIYNAVKHASPSRIIVSLEQEADTLSLEVSDDGQGFSGPGHCAGMGMRIMEYRARMIGASLKVNSTPNRGTKVRLRLQQDKNEQGDIAHA